MEQGIRNSFFEGDTEQKADDCDDEVEEKSGNKGKAQVWRGQDSSWWRQFVDKGGDENFIYCSSES